MANPNPPKNLTPGHKGKRLFNDSPFAKLRSLQILKRKLTSGLPDAVIAQEFGIHHETVARALKRTVKAELIERFEEELYRDLVPQAVATAKAAMVDGNATVAIEILKGAGLLKKQASHPETDNEQDDLEIYIRAKRHRQANQADKALRLQDRRAEPAQLASSPPQIEAQSSAVDGATRLPGTKEPPTYQSAIDAEVVELGD